MKPDTQEKRMIGDYEIILSTEIGNREIVVGESDCVPQDEKYVCALCTTMDMLSRCDEAMVSGDYLEIMQLYGERITKQATEFVLRITPSPTLEIDDTPVIEGRFTPITDDDDLHGKVILIDPKRLKREYRRATQQYQLCTGGFGASPRSRGNAVYCTNLFSMERTRFDRSSVLGIVSPDQLPDWAAAGIKQAEKKRRKEMGVR